MEWISKTGIAIMRRKSSSNIVTRKASPRATGLMVLDISHSINSVSTAVNATVEAKVKADKRLIIGRAWLVLEENGRAYALVFKDWASPDRKGKSFWSTNVETNRNVMRKGREEKTIAVKAGIVPGLHSSQSGSISKCYEDKEVGFLGASSGPRLVELMTTIEFQCTLKVIYTVYRADFSVFKNGENAWHWSTVAPHIQFSTVA